MSDIASRIGDRSERRSSRSLRRQRRVVAVLLLGPVTILGALVWAIAQPYRLVFLDPGGKGAYDYLVQPPLLAALVGLLFMVLIAPGLAEDLEREGDGSET